MKNSLIIAVSLVSLALAGCGKKDETPAATETPGMAATDAMGTPAVAVAASPAQTFTDTAAASDMFEVETSKLAATKAQSAKVKTFAEQMIKAHTDSTAQLKTAAAAATPAITPAPKMSAMQEQTLSDLSAKSGAAFDTAYAKAQVDAHQMTLDALKAYAASGDAPSLKAFAGKMVPTVTGHLNMAKGL